MAKKTKKNISKGKNKKKRQAQKVQQQQQAVALTAEQKAEIAKQEAREAEEKEKAKAKAIEEKKRQKEKEENPGFFTKSVDFVKSTWGELKKTQWLDAAELNKATASVFGIVSVFTVLTWAVDSGLGAIAALILEL